MRFLRAIVCLALVVPSGVLGADPDPEPRKFDRRACLSYTLSGLGLGGAGYLYYVRRSRTPAREQARWQQREDAADELERYLKAKSLIPPQRLHVTHVGQNHWISEERRKDWSKKEKAEFLPSVVRSQMEIAAFLRSEMKRGMNLHVFPESREDDLTPEDYALLDNDLSGDKLVTQCRRAFPKGYPLPDGLGNVSLTPDQEEVLARAGAALVLWSTGEIKHLYASDKEDIVTKSIAFDRTVGRLSSSERRFESYRLRHTLREIHALSLIVQKFPKGSSPRDKIVLIFGATHHLTRYTHNWLHVDAVMTEAQPDE